MSIGFVGFSDIYIYIYIYIYICVCVCVNFDLNFIEVNFQVSNRLVSQMRATLAASREPAGKLWQLCKVSYVFEQKNAIYFNPCSIYPHSDILTHR